MNCMDTKNLSSKCHERQGNLKVYFLQFFIGSCCCIYCINCFSGVFMIFIGAIVVNNVVKNVSTVIIYLSSFSDFILLSIKATKKENKVHKYLILN